MNTDTVDAPTLVYHVIKGNVIEGADIEYGAGRSRFHTPTLDLDTLTWSRQTPPPASDIPVAEIMDILVALGKRLRADPDRVLAEALEHNAKTNPLPRDLIERYYGRLGDLFDRAKMEFMLEQELGGADVVDGWREVMVPGGRRAQLRAFPPRLIHVLAGNSPGVSAGSLIRGALVKGVNLFKLPSNDLFTAPALLKMLTATAPGHPLTKSFSAVYWKGGDQSVEGRLFRPQFFDKLVAWGGEASIRSAVRHIGPGFELVSFDPKSSISLIGREALESAEVTQQVADLAAADATISNQQACVSSRFQFVEGGLEDVDRFCAELQSRLGLERQSASSQPWPTSSALREEIDGLREMSELYRVWGNYSGAGVVIRSDEPVEFYPDGKVVNVVRVPSLESALRYVNVATQTVGIYPAERKEALRNSLAAAGVQRVVSLGRALTQYGLPHDGFYPLQRFVRWVNDED
jgi:hypothetical protein